jgi:hypothetical protein
MTPDERVRRLVDAGSVAPEEGARLLVAMGRGESRSLASTLINPFERFGGGTAALAGVLIAASCIGVSRFGVRFDGFLDMHAGGPVPSLGVALVDQLVSWPLPATLFFLYARAFSLHVRLLDFIGMVGLARLPVLIGSLVIGVVLPDAGADPSRMTPGLLLVLALGLVFLGLQITLLYTGFKNASGFTGARLVGGFVGMSIAAEVASKLALLAL